MIRVDCESCGKKFVVGVKYAGQTGKCPNCSATIRVPDAEAPDTDLNDDLAALAAAASHAHEPPDLETDVDETDSSDDRLKPAINAQTEPKPPEVAARPQTPDAPVDLAAARQVLESGDGKKSQGSSSLGIASLVVGVVAVLICWLPIVGAAVGLIGLGLGVSGIVLVATRRGGGMGFPVAGTALSVVAVAVGLTLTFLLWTSARQLLGWGDDSQYAARQTPVARPLPNPIPQVEPAPKEPSPTPQPKPSTPTPQPVTPAPAPAATWTDASQAIQYGDIQVQIVSASVGRVRLPETLLGGGGRSRTPLLSIDIQITNQSDARKLELRKWSSSGRRQLTLVDDVGNQYKPLSGFEGIEGLEGLGDLESLTDVPGLESLAGLEGLLGGGQTLTAGKIESIYPGKSVRDTILFEEPVEAAAYLRLELPAANFGGDEVIRFQIPADMIQRGGRAAKAVEPPPAKTEPLVESIAKSTGPSRAPKHSPASAPEPTPPPAPVITEVANLLVESDELPVVFDRLKLSGVSVVGDAILEGRGRAVAAPRDLDMNLAVRRVHTPESTRLVQLQIEGADAFGQKFMDAVGSATQPPALLDSGGRRIFPLGYTLTASGSVSFEVSPQEPIRTISRFSPQRVQQADFVRLYFAVPIPRRIVQFTIGDLTLPVNPPLRIE